MDPELVPCVLKQTDSPLTLAIFIVLALNSAVVPYLTIRATKSFVWGATSKARCAEWVPWPSWSSSAERPGTKLLDTTLLSLSASAKYGWCKSIPVSRMAILLRLKMDLESTTRWASERRSENHCLLDSLEIVRYITRKLQAT